MPNVHFKKLENEKKKRQLLHKTTIETCFLTDADSSDAVHDGGTDRARGLEHGGRRILHRLRDDSKIFRVLIGGGLPKHFSHFPEIWANFQKKSPIL